MIVVALKGTVEYMCPGRVIPDVRCSPRDVKGAVGAHVAWPANTPNR